MATNAGGGSLALLIDTHVLVWALEGSERLSRAAADALLDPAMSIVVSAVTAWEYADLHARGRLPSAADFETARMALRAEVLALPASLWRMADQLARYHRDPVDRTLIAHAIHAGLTLVTADVTIRAYPVRTLW